jgi:replicative DNA helicase
LFGGRLYGLSGASGSGKTSLAWQIARSIAEATPIINGEPESQVLFESLEMDGEELVTRDLTYLTGIPSAAIESATLSEGEFGRVVDGYEAEQRKLPLVIDSAKSQTVGMIRGKAQRLKRLKGLSALVVDHWRYLKPSSRGDWMETMNEDLRALNAIADDLDVPVILIAQLKASYGSESTDWRKLREPNVGDIFNGAVLEQECDALILVHRMEYMLARRKPSDTTQVAAWEEELRKHIGRAQLILNKRRGGGGYGRRTVGFDAPTTRFSDSFKPVDFFSPIQGLSPETSLV